MSQRDPQHGARSQQLHRQAGHGSGAATQDRSRAWRAEVIQTARATPSRTGTLRAEGERRIHVVQGQYQVTDEPEAVLTTILGSCVAACLCDPVARVGGMNHFLLPDDNGCDRGRDATRYGVHAMELLINGLLQHGARRERLEAKLFGGAKVLEGLSNVGAQNAAFAERFLSQECIMLKGGSLRGERGRCVQFWPVSGRAQQRLLKPNEVGVFTSERYAKATTTASSSVELF